MILQKLRLNNYRQHKDRTVKFDGNLILVTGRNGSGKSNLIGAIQFALTGEQAGVKKEQLLSWGAPDGEVELWFEHGGTQAHVLRSLSGSAASFTFGDQKYRGISNVNAAIALHIGLDKDVARQTVFVRQGALDEALFNDPRARELAFQRLLGIGEAAKIYKLLTDKLAALNTQQEYATQIAAGKQLFAERHARLAEVTAAVQALETKSATLPTVQLVQEGIAGKLAELEMRKRIGPLRERRNAVATTLDTLRASLAALPVYSESLADLDLQIAATSKLHRQVTEYQYVANAWLEAGRALLSLGDPPTTDADVAKMYTAFVSAKADYDGLAGQLALHRTFEQALSKREAGALNACPVCGAPVTNIAALRTRLATAIAELTALQASMQPEIDKLSKAWASARQNLAQYEATKAQLLKAGADADAKLKTLAKPCTTDTAELEKLVAELTAKRKLVMDNTLSRNDLSAKIAADETSLQRLDADLAAIPYAAVGTQADNVATITRLQADIVAANASIGEIQQIHAQLSSARGAVTELNRTLNELLAQIAVLEQKQAQSAAYAAALQVLGHVRDWFKYDNGPRTLSTNVLNEMTDDVNRFLSYFTAPFTVAPVADTLGYSCLFTDGRDMPADGPPDASELSGGQKVQLAVAFRLASYCMFANKLGLLSLDEPTCYLDAANVGRFCDLMQQVKKVAHSMQVQIIMATHEEALKPFADTVIDLT